MSGAFDELEDWARKAMRFVDLCDADAAGYDDLHEDAEGLLINGFQAFGLDPLASGASIDHLEYCPLMSIAVARDMLEALERAEKHVETLHSLVGCSNPRGDAAKIVWRDLKLARAAIARAKQGLAP